MPVTPESVLEHQTIILLCLTTLVHFLVMKKILILMMKICAETLKQVFSNGKKSFKKDLLAHPKCKFFHVYISYE